MKLLQIIIILSVFCLAGCEKIEKKITNEKAPQPETVKNKYVTWPMWEVDRAASIWLIKRYIDSDAEFTFVNKGEPLDNAIPFDIPEAELQRKHNTACFQVIMRKYKLNKPELQELSKLVWDIEINFWGAKKYAASVPFKEKFDKVFSRKQSADKTMEQCFALFDDFIKKYKLTKKSKSLTKTIETSKPEVDVGSFNRGETRIIKFNLKNESNNKIKIKQVRKTCGCVKAFATPEVIPKGGTYTVTVSLLANKELYGPFIKSVYVMLEDSNIVKLSIIGNAKRTTK